ncbi:MAG TPA: type I restriction endonuclease subunit R [Cyanobacteria bacterium UBA11149]|nr:type I restriction endonuclease subunit R [Cyanobacteria bacterium UBA11367]HBE59288.1 type I restriction endonuclease subunit R [Cyanobacteria bacterium UBA11366]HBK64843.1 type I restriction endonuclease subunit R [Cyanobacteria bacterium UBA11166]HBR76241.1 type I restriction endonuclease subunit R [Cyanobacteria bacterium UBA11159]HBS67709.1 type I restriction endonuclease subunit R [Cyanobacteria bacterium UBA11153]HBW91832.1 type I restriction endonuclease subunit R [Cyanobacteria bac
MDPFVEHILTYFEAMGYTVLLESDIISGRDQEILRSYCNGIIGNRFRQAMARINPTVSPQQIELIFHLLTQIYTMPMMQQNRRWHLQLLASNQVDASVVKPNSLATLKLIDFSNVLNNDWLAIYSFPAIEGDYQHCLDLVIFINGLPLVVFHGIHGGDKSWSLRSAYFQLQEYKEHLPKFFSFNELLVLSNRVQSRIGTLTSQWKQFIPISSANGEDTLFSEKTEIETLIKSVFHKQRFLEIIQHFIVFQQSRTKLNKRLISEPFWTVNNPNYWRYIHS